MVVFYIRVSLLAWDTAELNSFSNFWFVSVSHHPPLPLRLYAKIIFAKQKSIHASSRMAMRLRIASPSRKSSGEIWFGWILTGGWPTIDHSDPVTQLRPCAMSFP